MRSFIVYIPLLGLFFSCQNKSSNTTSNVADTILLAKESSISKVQFLSLIINGDTIDYPFKFSKRFIKTEHLPTSSKKMNEYLIQLKEILPYYLTDINDSNKFNLFFTNGLSDTYQYKFDRKKLQLFFNEDNVDNTYTNGILNKSLMYSNLKTDIENILPNNYLVKNFSSEKVDFNINNLKRDSKESVVDSIGFSETPFIGMLWINIEKQN